MSSLERINGFLENREDVLSEKEIKKIVYGLKYVTRWWYFCKVKIQIEQYSR